MDRGTTLNDSNIGLAAGVYHSRRVDAVPDPEPHEALIGDRLAGILHVDDPLRLAAYARLAASLSADGLLDADRRLMTGFHFDERSEHLAYPLDLAQPAGSPVRVPLSVHARHTVDDVLTAFGIPDFNKTTWKQTGAMRDDSTNSDLFFVTLEKSEREYSPSTLYKDHAISPTLSHWESQSTSTQHRTQHRATSTTETVAGISCCSCVQERSRTAHDAIHVLRRRRLRLAQGRAANQLCVDIAQTDARGLLQAGESSQRLNVTITTDPEQRSRPSLCSRTSRRSDATA